MTDPQAERTDDLRRQSLAASDDWQVVLRHFDYNHGFALGLILLPDSGFASTCRAALHDHLLTLGKELLDVSPGSVDELKYIASRLLTLHVSEDVATVWVAAVTSESDSDYEAWSAAWREGLARLNQFRNILQRQIPCTLFFVGASWVQAIIRTMAPDIWSVRSLVALVAPTGVKVEGSIASSQIATSPPADAPDPYFALKEAEQLRGKEGQELSFARLLYRAGTGFNDRGEFEKATDVLRESLDLQYKFKSPPRQLADAEVILAQSLVGIGQPGDSMAHYEKGIALYRAAGDLVAVANTLASQADALTAVGDLAEARKLQEEVVDIFSRVLGPEHPSTLTCMNNLAWTIAAQGDLAAARKLREETLSGYRRVLGPEHPNTLTSMNNLASTLWAQGDSAGARKLTEETLAIRRRVLGLEHPDTLTSMNNLANILYEQGDLAGARKLHEEALDICRRVLGPEHPDTLTSMSNLAETLRAEGDLAGARKLQEETLAVRRRVLRPEHPDTLTSMNNLAETHRAQGEMKGARKLQEETLGIRRRVLGPEHPDTLTSMNNLSVTLDAMGELAAEWKLQEEVLDIRRRVLGPKHPKTSTSAWNLFRTLHDLNERAAARAVLESDLLWLLDRDPTTLGADQRKIREYVAEEVKKSG